MEKENKLYNTGANPVHTGIYLVDRGEKLGEPFRYFDADTQFWSRCEYTIEDMLKAKDKPSALGFLPWRGPIKVAKPKPVAEVALVNDVHVTNTNNPVDFPKAVKPTKAVKAVKVAKPKVAKAPSAGKAVHPDGTILWREDRQKYMAFFGGKSEAARPTIEAAKAFLTKKYGITEFTVIGK